MTGCGTITSVDLCLVVDPPLVAFFDCSKRNVREERRDDATGAVGNFEFTHKIPVLRRRKRA
jgi:hypothetical protein